MIHFDTLLGRADEDTLGQLVGDSAVRLMRLLDPTLMRSSVLRQVVTDLHEPHSILRDPAARRALLMLARPDEAVELATALDLRVSNGRTVDLYEQLTSLQMRAGSRNERRLQQLLHVHAQDPPSLDPQLGKELLEFKPDYGMYTHQRDAVARANTALAEEPRRVLLHMPTGSGKTRVAMNIIADHLRQLDPALVVWLAHSEELCNQAVQEFDRAWSALGNRTVSVVRYWGSHNPDISSTRDGLIVAGLAKIHRMGSRSVRQLASLADHTSLVVFDEAHLAAADTYSLILEVLASKRPGTRMMGLTATPGRTWCDIDADEELSSIFSRRKVTLNVDGYENPIDYLVDEGYLSRANFRSLFYDGGYTPSEKDLKQISQSLEIPHKIVQRLALDEQRNLVIVREVEHLAETHSRILLFAATVGHARLIAAVLRIRGLSASAITSETSALERQRILSQFLSAADETQVLCNFGVLTTGFDAPGVSAAVIARPTTSLVLYSQMVGRAIRGPLMGGTRHCEIVTVADRDLPGFGSVAESFMNWEDIWEESH